MKPFDGSLTVGKIGDYAVLCLFMLLISAVWIESDVYRYAAVILVLWGLVEYWNDEFKPSIGWMGYICIAWVAFVAIRYAIVYLDPSVQSHGTSEGIYLFPILYMTVGYMMVRYRHMLGKAAVLFIVISFVVAAATLQPSALLEEGRHDFLIMNNTIHSSVGAGFIILASINFAGFAARNIGNIRRKILYEALAYITIALCLVGLYGAKSKGVWAAIIIAICLQILLSVRNVSGRRGWMIGTASVGMAALFVFAFRANVWSTVGPSYESAVDVLLGILRTERPLDAIHAAIASQTVPEGMNVRLMLWANAAEVWSHNILLGNGIAWKELWMDARYKDAGFDLIHNGYLEIAVRYGVLGLLFYATLYGWSIVMADRAYRRGLIPREVFYIYTSSLVFFLATIMTNSNNRLAIGEAYMMVAAAFGFYCCFCQNLGTISNLRGKVHDETGGAANLERRAS